MQNALLSRGLRPTFFDCGSRAKYVTGCRCDACRAANTAYARRRAAVRRIEGWNGIVSARRARAHMQKLSRLGVGRRAVKVSTDIADSVLHAIATGRKLQIRARTERLILGVNPGCALDRSRVPAARTWQQIGWLIEEGFTKRRISKEIGQGGRALQLGREFVTARNAAKVERLYRRFSA